MLAQHHFRSNLTRDGVGLAPQDRRGRLSYMLGARRLSYILIAILIAGLALIPSFAAPAKETKAAATGVRPAVGKVRWAYYVPYAPNSLNSLKEYANALDYLSPYWYQVAGEGNVLNSGSGEINETNRRQVLDLANAAGLRVVPMIKNRPQYGDFSAVLNDPALRAHAIEEVRRVIVDSDFPGAHIDFEGIKPEDRDALSSFMTDLAAVLRPMGRLVTQAVPAKDQERTTGWAGAYDYKALGQANDLIVLMTYGYGTGAPQSTSPYPWVEASAGYAASQIPADKLLLGLAWYGYDWNVSRGGVAALTFNEAAAHAQQYQANVEYDDRAQAAHYLYEAGGDRHEAWFEDRRSNDAELDLVFRYGLAGAAGWRMGHEDSGVWNSFRDRLGYRTWYLAEGATTPPFDTWILLQNPNSYPITASLTFMKEDGTNTVQRYTLRAVSRLSIYANQVVPNSAFATRIESTGPVLVERAMYQSVDGHDSTGVNSPERRWYLPDGNSLERQDNWVLLMNPNAYPVNVRLSFLMENGSPVAQDVKIGAASRLTVYANQYAPAVRFSTLVEADGPVVAERAAYSDRGVHGSPGASSLSTTWYLAEGFTGHQVTIALMNPSRDSARVTLTFMMENAGAIKSTVTLPPMSRGTVTGPAQPAATGYSTLVESDKAIAVERTSTIVGQGAHSSLGSPAPARTWFLAEGATAAPFATFVLIQNPNPVANHATVAYMTEKGQNLVGEYDLAPNSRFTIAVNDVVPNNALSVRVDATLPVVVERAMYFGKGSHDSIGISQ